MGLAAAVIGGAVIAGGAAIQDKQGRGVTEDTQRPP